ncbi:hypothetical protein B0T24DRAFT_597548 [Lasiosphaeria ovina]|uniref:Uncharacterized protein n=1 Tax=Lasiosphaeria ovina TaxID=92902 RepID=A0AAE0JWR2_9PEZI|nr:hypothetical protein B0T24DRAFT_597548 [Lasiosphaeria ovina]
MARSRPKKKGRGRKERNGAGGIWSLRWRQYDEKGGVYQSETINFRKSDKKTAAFRRLRKLQLVFFFCTPIASSSELLHPQMGAMTLAIILHNSPAVFFTDDGWKDRRDESRET